MSDDSSIERVRRKLYAREAPKGERERRALHEIATDPVNPQWEVEHEVADTKELDPREEARRELEELRSGVVRGVNDDIAPILMFGKRVEERQKKKKSAMGRLVSTIFFSSLAFFVFAGGVSFYILMSGNTEAGCAKIDIDVEAPTAVASGKELLVDVGVRNKNAVALERTQLMITYPEGTKSPDDPSLPLPTIRTDIGAIAPQERVLSTSRALLYGREQTSHVIKVRLEYSLKDSERVFVCDKEYPVVIATAPVALSVSGFQEISSGQEFTLKAVLGSNADEVVSDQRLVVSYPFGFRFLRADPSPSEGENVWDIGDMPPGFEKTIEITGVVDTQTVESRTVSFRLGERDSTSATEVGSALKIVEHPLLVTRPFMDITVLLNDNANKTVAVVPGSVVNGKVLWKNELPDSVYDVSIEGVLPSSYIDRRSVRVSEGYYNSSEQSMQWTPQTDRALREIGPGETGVLNFSFRVETLGTDTGARNPEVPLSFTVRARRVSDPNEVPQILKSLGERVVQLQSVPLFAGYTTYSTGPFKNTGPFPPRAESETTYTITWQVKNSTNNLRDVTVRAGLPLYSEWMEQTHPGDEQVSYNPNTREVVWTLGDVPASTGSEVPPRELAFRIAVLPSVTHISSYPVLVNGPKLRGVDVFTGSMVERSVRDHTTRLTNDPLYAPVEGKVLE
jgi:hypothetical protein